MKISLDLHDFSVLNNRLDLLTKLREHYPQAKVSLFTIPYHFEFEKTTEGRITRPDALKAVKENLDWFQIIPHGLAHIPNEFEKADSTAMKLSIQAIDEAFKKDELPYEKGFCAPYWLWNRDVIDVLDESGWWGAIDRNQPDMEKTKMTYTYTHSIDEPFWKSDKEIIKLHGHIDGASSNDLEMNFLNLMKIPSDAEWHFVSDFVE